MIIASVGANCFSKRKLIPWLKLILRNQTLLESSYHSWSYTVSTGMFVACLCGANARRAQAVNEEERRGGRIPPFPAPLAAPASLSPSSEAYRPVSYAALLRLNLNSWIHHRVEVDGLPSQNFPQYYYVVEIGRTASKIDMYIGQRTTARTQHLCPILPPSFSPSRFRRRVPRSGAPLHLRFRHSRQRGGPPVSRHERGVLIDHPP